MFRSRSEKKEKEDVRGSCVGKATQRNSIRKDFDEDERKETSFHAFKSPTLDRILHANILSPRRLHPSDPVIVVSARLLDLLA